MKFDSLIVGLGQIGMGYDYDLDPNRYILSHARSFSIHPGFELVGGVDKNPHQCKKFEAMYGKTAYKDLKQALREQRPDVVIIATPSDMHGSTLKEIIRHHIPKAIVSEKPLDYSLKVGQQMIKLCQENDILLFVNYMRRSEHSVLEIKKMIDNKVIKTPVDSVVCYSKGILNNGSHMLNLLEYWLGKVRNSKVIKADVCSTRKDPEPNFIVTFEKGSAVFIAREKKKSTDLSIEIQCPSGLLHYGKNGEQIYWQKFEENASVSNIVPRNKKIIIDNDMARYQLNFTQNLFLALSGCDHSICTGLQALETLKNVTDIIRNSENGSV